MTPRLEHMRAPLISAGVFAVALLLVNAAAIPVRPPRSFVLELLFFVLPFAFACVWTFQWAPFVIGTVVTRNLSLVCAGLGVVAIIVYPYPPVWWVLFLAAIVSGALGIQSLARVLLQVVTLGFGYAALWLAQYVVASLVEHRVLDRFFMAGDLWVYRDVLGITTDYQGVFPLVRHPLLFAMVERSYFMLFGEIAAVALVCAGAGVRCGRRFCAVLFGGYAFSLLVFGVWPVVGPCIYVPESFDPAYAHTATATVMGYMAADFWRNSGPLTGYGYFVALPSMHVALAVFLHRVLFLHAPLLSAFFALPNVLIAASTFLLGYHYLADVPPGALLGFVMGSVYLRSAAAARPANGEPG
jgi:hypothetical protein